MDENRNPFVPGAGTQPPELAGRSDLIKRAEVTLERMAAGRFSKSMIIIGLRGVGKTVLLNRFRESARERGYADAYVEAHEQKLLPELLVPELRRIILELDRLGAVEQTVKRALRGLRGFMSAFKLSYAGFDLGIDPLHGEADSGDLEADLPSLFALLGEAARSRGRLVSIFVDEVQYLSETDMSALIMALHRTAQQNLPVTMLAAGLPQVVGLTGRSKSYSERLFDFPEAGPLTREDATAALTAPTESLGVTWSADAVATALAATQGYPYFLQEWGYQTWNAAQGSRIEKEDVDRATKEAVSRLDASFFRVRFDRLTPAEREYLRAMAQLGPGPHRSGDVADELGKSVMLVGPRRAKLIAKGMVYSPAHGDTAFTVPMFDQFMVRAIPDWPIVQRRRGARG
ncbi:MAG: ATP-binding protein [Proteobacteria bacterium]|nr:ATP-binding protein [Pseudomonadota bacterium]